MASGLEWREVHRHVGRVTSLAWSPSGSHLFGADGAGDVFVSDELTWTPVKIFSAEDGGDNHRGVCAAWDCTRDVIGVDARGGFRIIDLDGHAVATAPELFTWKLRARPIVGGYAWVEHGTDQRHRICINQWDGTEPKHLPGGFSNVRDLAWSPDGRNLAIATDWGVTVARPWATATFDLSIDGGVNALVWLDDMRLAAGCVDTNIRIFAWHEGVERSIPFTAWPGDGSRNRPGAALIDVLEAHDQPISGLSGPNTVGQFCSWDNRTLHIWSHAARGFIALSSADLVTGERSHDIELAIHPHKPIVALDLDETVSIASFDAYSGEDSAPPAEGAPSLMGTVLSRAGIIGAVVHSDSIAIAWHIESGKTNESAVHKVAAARQRKVVAASTRKILQQVERCLRLLWLRPVGEAQVVLGTIAHSKVFASDCQGVRKQLLALLATEIKLGEPRSRVWATTAYVGIGHLGLVEVGLAFGPESATRELLSRMDEELRAAVHVAANLLPDSHSLCAIGAAVQGAATGIETVLRRHAESGGTLLRSDIAHTLILKGGGAKGLAHVGAVLELSRYYTFDRFVGTSAGAIVAVLLGAGFTARELLTELQKTSFDEKILQSWPRCLWNLITKRGIFDGDGLQNWLGNLLSTRRDTLNPVLMPELQHTTVYACAPNNPEVKFDSEDGGSAHVPASYAARCSMSIPFYFTPASIGGIPAFDGGLRINYPVEQVLSDDRSKPFIGLYLGSKRGMTDAGTSVVKALLLSLFDAKDRSLAEKHRSNTVILETSPIGTLDFKLSPEEKRFLVLSGRVAALRFLEGTRAVELEDRHVLEMMIAELNNLRQRVIATRAEERSKHWLRLAAWSAALLAGGLAAWRWMPAAFG